MVGRLISFSLRNQYVVLLIAAGLFAWGIYSVSKNPIDAIPDLSENQVIVFTEWVGRSPQVIEDQITYPLVSYAKRKDWPLEVAERWLAPVLGY